MRELRFNIGQRLLAQTYEVESLIAEVTILREKIRGLEQENKELHRLTANYSTSMKRKHDQLQNPKVRFITITKVLWQDSESNRCLPSGAANGASGEA